MYLFKDCSQNRPRKEEGLRYLLTCIDVKRFCFKQQPCSVPSRYGAM